LEAAAANTRKEMCSTCSSPFISFVDGANDTRRRHYIRRIMMESIGGPRPRASRALALVVVAHRAHDLLRCAG
jgi:hypothetical protein